jgi:hypothetical protein
MYELLPTAGVLKTSPVAEGQTAAGPLTEAGVEGRIESVMFRKAPVPQAFCADTESVPEVKPVAGTSTVMEVPRFSTIVQAAGMVQL